MKFLFLEVEFQLKKLQKIEAVTDITSYGISDVKSVYSNTGIAAGTNGNNIAGINTFSANVVQLHH